MLLASSAIPAGITFLLRLGLPESPMWLKARGREAEAEAIVRRHFGPGHTIPALTLEQSHPSPAELFRHKNWRAHLYAGLFWFCQIGPFFAIFTFAMPVFRSLGIDSGVTVDILLNGLQIVGAVFGLWLLHWLTRRHFVIWTFAIMFAVLLLLGLLPDAPTWLIVTLFAGYMFIAPAANNMQFVYPSEIFETRIRSTGVGFAAAFSRISAAAATYLLPVTMQAYGVSATLLIMAAFPLLGLVVSGVVLFGLEQRLAGYGVLAGCLVAAAALDRRMLRDLLLIAAGLVVLALGAGLVMPIALAGAVDDFPDRAGTANAAASLLQTVGAGVGSALASLPGDHATTIPAAMVALTLLAAALFAALARHQGATLPGAETPPG